MINNEIAKKLANEFSLNWENLQNILDNIELGELERNLTKICFMAKLFNDRVLSTNEVASRLRNNYGLTSESIQWCCQMIDDFSHYHKNFLKEKSQTITNQEYVNLKDFSEDASLPKSLIIRIDKDEEKYGITDINCTIRKERSYDDGLGKLSIFGEIKHRKIDKTVLIYIIVYNDKNEIICYDSETSLSSKKGAAIIDCRLEFPIDENISAIYLKPALDPWTHG
ncbi:MULTISPECIES: hypothetical protein [Lactobacillus]|uniref:hypothetical protein n=1 Tax=Lactobacillus TaxID=1578 RepID=UPI002627A22C|nr:MULTISPECIES: hypothetical protein [Lactobacillus]